MPDLQFEFGGEDREGRHGLSPIGIAALRTSARMVAGLAIAPDDTSSGFARQWKLAWWREVCCSTCADGMFADMAVLVEVHQTGFITWS